MVSTDGPFDDLLSPLGQRPNPMVADPKCPHCYHFWDDHYRGAPAWWEGHMGQCWNCLRCNPAAFPPHHLEAEG